jgi:hypothetical protein
MDCAHDRRSESMTRDELVMRLSEDPQPARLGPTAMMAATAVAALAVVLALSLLWLQPRPDLGAGLLARDPAFVLKLIFTAGVAASALPVVRNLAIPGRPLRSGAVLVALPFVTMALLALLELRRLPPGQWFNHVEHASWFDCLWQIPALALPAFVILAVGVRLLAPTQLIRTGAFLGLVAGGFGAIGYALHCHDDAITFVALFYSAAIAEVIVLGALAGPRILRWR